MAVEFALLLPLLMAILFGMVQYGYGLYQYQAFTAALDTTARRAATGISSCDWLENTFEDLLRGNGLPVDADHTTGVTVGFIDPDGDPAPSPQRLGYLQLTGTYADPLQLNIPLVPFPETFTAPKRVLVQGVEPVELGDCVVNG